MSRDFSFKQFTVSQKSAAFKVGTDSVVLGAWANIASSQNILDIGTGTGLLALMCAQRNAGSHVVAIEKDKSSFEDATSNFAASSWKERLLAMHVPLEDYIPDIEFDYIICNPPYFLNALLPVDSRKADARHASPHWFGVLAEKVNSLCAENGIFGCVLPQHEFEVLNEKLSSLNWFPIRIQKLLPYPNADKIRVLVEWKRGEQKTEELSDIFVRNGARDFDSTYIALTHAFYLNFKKKKVPVA